MARSRSVHFVKNLDAVPPELTEARNFHFQRPGDGSESGDFPHCGQLTHGDGNGLRRPAKQALAAKQQTVLFVDILAGRRLGTPILFLKVAAKVVIHLHRWQVRDQRMIRPWIVRAPEFDNARGGRPDRRCGYCGRFLRSDLLLVQRSHPLINRRLPLLRRARNILDK